MICPECYAENARATPLLGARECLENHTQYICGTCGRCICIEKDPKRKLQRWNFPFRTAEIARLYLRAADATMKKPCGIYELKDKKGRIFYKIFSGEEELQRYLQKNKDKICEQKRPVFSALVYKSCPGAQIRRLTEEEAKRYLAQREDAARAEKE